MLVTPSKTIVVPAGSVVKNLPEMAGDTGLIPESGRSPEEGNGNPLQYCRLDNSTALVVIAQFHVNSLAIGYNFYSLERQNNY